jgi:MerR family transcriptional regulator, copper efflux regulator
MTIGELSKRTGVSPKALRRYEGLGLIYTAGRSAGNYRLFDESALWCVQVIHNLRALGLSMSEICDLASVYLGRPDQPIGPHLAERLHAVRVRLDRQIAELTGLRGRIDTFEAAYRAELAGRPGADFRAGDPRTPTPKG